MLGRDSLGSLGRCGFAGYSPTRNQPRHHGAFTSITFLTDLNDRGARRYGNLHSSVGGDSRQTRSPSLAYGAAASVPELSAPQPTPNRFPALSRNSTGGLFYGLFAGFTAFNLDVDD